MHNEDKNYMAIVCGDTGSGKSEFALRLCEVIDPDFSNDQVAFTIQEFMELVNEDVNPGSMILFDEVGVALDAATHYDHDQIRLNHVLETWREQNRGLIMTAPHIRLVQKKSRGLLHAQMDMQDIDRNEWLSVARYRNIQQNTDTGDLYKKYPRLRDPSIGRVRKFKKLALYKPTNRLVDPYLTRKKAFNDSLNKDILDDVTDDEYEQLTVQDIAERIGSNGLDDYISTHQTRGTKYFDWQLIRADYELSKNDARTVKKLLEREFDPEQVVA